MKLEKITLHNLEEILQTHPTDFQLATEELPNLRHEMTSKKLAVEKLENELYLIVKEELTKKGEKFTEGVVLANVKTYPEYIKAQKEWLDARREYDKIEHLKEVFYSREQSIKLLAQLFQSQYWSLSNLEALPKPDSNSTSKFKARS